MTWPPRIATLQSSTMVAITVILIAGGVFASGFGFDRALSYVMA